MSRVLPPLGRLPVNGCREQGPEEVGGKGSRHPTDDSLVVACGGPLVRTGRDVGSATLALDSHPGIQVGFPPGLGIQQKTTASCSLMVPFGLLEFICVCQS